MGKAFDPTVASAAASSSIAHGFQGGTPPAGSGELTAISSMLGSHMAQKNTPGAGITPTHGHYTSVSPGSAQPKVGALTPMPAHTVHSSRF